MDTAAFWILALDLLVLSCLAASFGVLLKRAAHIGLRRAGAWAVRVWSETLNGIAEDIR